METQLHGEVRWYHVARSRAVRRILERSIARWMELHQLTAPHYRAVLQREGDGHYVHCQIEILSGTGDEAWLGSRVGSGLQQALADCLAHMTRRASLGDSPGNAS